MSALAHFIESEGVATTGISLVREHTERMRPPRALWVPFELGRPFGAPDDAAFQHRVLQAALALLEEASGPVLADFPDDAPAGAAADSNETGMTCPVSFPPPPADKDDLGAAVVAEIGRLSPWYIEAMRRHGGRTTVRGQEFEIDAAARFAASFLNGPPASDAAAARRLKTALEDLKAYYSEAAVTRPGIASTEVANWLWRETALGELMFQLAESLRSGDDPGLRYLSEQSLVPRTQAVWRKARGA